MHSHDIGLRRGLRRRGKEVLARERIVNVQGGLSPTANRRRNGALVGGKIAPGKNRRPAQSQQLLAFVDFGPLRQDGHIAGFSESENHQITPDVELGVFGGFGYAPRSTGLVRLAQLHALTGQYCGRTVPFQS